MNDRMKDFCASMREWALQRYGVDVFRPTLAELNNAPGERPPFTGEVRVAWRPMEIRMTIEELDAATVSSDMMESSRRATIAKSLAAWMADDCPTCGQLSKIPPTR